MSKAPIIVPLAVLPLAAVGLWLWSEAGAAVWLSGFIGACF